MLCAKYIGRNDMFDILGEFPNPPSPVPRSIAFTQKQVTLGINETAQLTTVFTPIDAKGAVVFSSSDDSIASIKSTGLVTAKKAGTVKIVAKAKNLSATCEVVVRPIAATSIMINAKDLKLTEGRNYQLSTTIRPALSTRAYSIPPRIQPSPRFWVKPG